MQEIRQRLLFVNATGSEAKSFYTKALVRNEDGQMLYETALDVWQRGHEDIMELFGKGWSFKGII